MEKRNNKNVKNNIPFMNTSAEIENKVNDLLKKLTLEEKFKLLAGKQLWFTKPIKRLGIPSLKMTDGPHGIAPHSSNNMECTYFPTGICRASTWNVDLSREFGEALGREVRDIGSHILLGPAINIIRTPLCGRNFEYQTEDPYLNSRLAEAVVKGIQSQRVAACVKHYVCNNQETNRFKVNAIVSERALEEIYFPAFKAAVVNSDAWSFMSCYNKVNGKYGSENEYLIYKKLINEWHFRGFVVSDWGATQFISKPENCINARLSLEMPRAKVYKKNLLLEAYEEGRFTDEALNDNVKRLLRVMFLVGLFENESSLPKGERNTKRNQGIARRIAEEGMVLLKNESNLLPLNSDKIKKIAIMGPNMDKKFGEGGGSSQVKPPYEITPYLGIKQFCANKIEIINNPEDADVVIAVMGYDHELGNDAESVDRKRYELPNEQVDLILEISEKNSNVIIVLIGGLIGMSDWVDKVPAIIMAWYPGMEGGTALANIIFGKINPSGKLPVTLPKTLSDYKVHESNRTYPGNDEVYYEEGIFIGYRYFDKYDINPLFPFGYGLSYTNFNYYNLEIDKQKITKKDSLLVSLNIKNEGNYYGGEIVQLYIQDKEASVERPIKELKGFKKIFLQPKEEKIVNFRINWKDLTFFDDNLKKWIVEDGEFIILIGTSSRDIKLRSKFEFKEK